MRTDKERLSGKVLQESEKRREKPQRKNRRISHAAAPAQPLWICGRNSVAEFLTSGAIQKLFVKAGKKDDRLISIISRAEKSHVPMVEVEEEKLETEDSTGKFFHGLPVTSAALVFPSVLLCHIVFNMDFTYLYSALLVIMGVLFISDIKVKKPTTKDILVMIAFGAMEAFILGLIFIFLKSR